LSAALKFAEKLNLVLLLGDAAVYPCDNALFSLPALQFAEKLRFEQGLGRARLQSCRKPLRMGSRFSARGELFSPPTTFSAACLAAEGTTRRASSLLGRDLIHDSAVFRPAIQGRAVEPPLAQDQVADRVQAVRATRKRIEQGVLPAPA